MPRCFICGSNGFTRKYYDNHTVGRTPGLIRKILGRKIPQTIPFSGTIIICSSCGYGVMESPPSANELIKYYEQEYWSERPMMPDKIRTSKDAFKDDLRARSQMEFIWEHLKGSLVNEILEIGAGPAFASLALREKWNGHLNLNVCEPGENWKEYYQEMDINCVSNFFPFKSEKNFDYIHTSHWLEHVENLGDTMRQLNQLLNQGGFIFVEVPNTEYYYWDLPLKDTPHIQFFTKSSLTKLFQKFGFKCLEVGSFGQTFYDKFKRIPLSDKHYQECEKGFWIRSIFRKI